MVLDGFSFLKCAEGPINSDSNEECLLPVPQAALLFPGLCSAGGHSPLAIFCPHVPVREFLGIMETPLDNAGSQKELDWQLGTAMKFCLTGVLCRVCWPWEAGKATLLLGSSDRPHTVPILGRRIPAFWRRVWLSWRWDLSSQHKTRPLW